MKARVLAIIVFTVLVFFENLAPLLIPPLLRGDTEGFLSNPALAEESQETITLNVRGMSCSQCTKRVEGELKKITGVKNVEANLKEAKVEITVEKGKVTAEQLTEAINNMGYWVEKK